MLVDLGDETCTQTEKRSDMIIIRSHLTQTVQDGQESWCICTTVLSKSQLLYCSRCLTSI